MTTLTTSFNNHRQDSRWLKALLGFNLLMVAATIGVYLITQKTLIAEKQEIFNHDAEKIQTWVEERMFSHVTTLRGLEAFWAAHPGGTPKQEFQLYLNKLNLLYQYPGLSSVVFVNKNYVTTYIEPLESREAAQGYDSSNDPVRRPLFDRARDSGEIIASQPLTLVTTGKPGFFLIAPLYTDGNIPRSLIDRQRQSAGYVLLVFRDTQLFKKIFGEENPFPNLDFVIVAENKVLFDSDPGFTPADTKLLQTKKFVTIGQTPWTIIISAKPSFSLTWAEEKLPLVTLFSGLTFSLAFALINIFFYRQHLKKWH